MKISGLTFIIGFSLSILIVSSYIIWHNDITLNVIFFILGFSNYFMVDYFVKAFKNI